MASPPVKKNQIVELEIEDLAYGGAGLAKIGGYVIFVEGALPGDRVKARISKKRPNHAQAFVEEMVRASSVRIEAPCPLHDGCGGCCWQNLPYKHQLEAKEQHVAESLEHIGGQGDLPIEPIEPSPKTFRYRNKMDFSFGADEEGRPILGFHRPGRFDRIFSVPACLLQPEPFDAVIQAVEEWARSSGLAPYDPRSHKGILRTLILRYSEANGQWLATILTATTDVGDHLKTLAGVLDEAAEGFSGLLWGFNDGVADFARMDREAGRIGTLTIEEHIDEFRFRISPFSFFQTNTQGAALLYRHVREFAGLSGTETLLDAYCGTGSIGIFCAGQARQVYGVDIVPDAICDARENAKANGFDNCIFLAAPLAKGLHLVRASAGRWLNRIVIDPPRGGMDKRSLRQLLEMAAPVFVYVSCNPATLSRDVTTICKAGYQIARVKPVDLFPQTYHIETVIRFER